MKWGEDVVETRRGRNPEGPGRTRPESKNKIALDKRRRPTNPLYMDARTIGFGASGASSFTNTSAPQTISATIALDAAVRDAIVYLVWNASELVDRTLDRLPDAASEVCSCGGVPAGAACLVL